MRRWREWAVVWGSTLCEAPGCIASAEMLAELDERDDSGVPVCVSCCDLLFDRAAAVDVLDVLGGPQLALPSLWAER